MQNGGEGGRVGGGEGTMSGRRDESQMYVETEARTHALLFEMENGMYSRVRT